MTSRLARVAVATAALFITASAFAEGTFTPELGWGRVSGGQVYHVDDLARNTASVDAAFGYRWDNGFGVRAMYLGAVDPFKDLFTPDSPRSFNDFYGVQGTGWFPLAGKLNLTTGLGLGRSSFNRGAPGSHVESTEGVVSAGLQYQPFTHFALELRFDYLAKSHERDLALMAQVPF